jgi:two-component sensor histidine kinase
VTGQREAERLLPAYLYAIATLTKVIDDHDQLEENYEDVLSVIKSALGADRVALLLADEQGVFRFQSSLGLSMEYRSAVNGHSPWSILTPNPEIICVENAETSAEIESYRALVLKEGIRALAFVPLLYRKQLLGKFMIYHNSPHHFSEAEIQLAETIAGLFSFALEHKRIERDLRAETQRRDLLMKEIHHRIKNNLQIVVSILGLQANQTDPAVRDILKDCENRVRSMAMIHEKLYNASSFTSVDIGAYLRELSETLFRSYEADGKVRMTIRCQSAEGAVDKAMYCGLLVSEILSNSLKHAFQDSNPGEVLVSFEQDMNGRFVLLIKDNGDGIPNRIEMDNGNSLGLRLISMLTAQLKGEVHLDRSEGSSFRIEFP